MQTAPTCRCLNQQSPMLQRLCCKAALQQPQRALALAVRPAATLQQGAQLPRQSGCRLGPSWQQPAQRQQRGVRQQTAALPLDVAAASQQLFDVSEGLETPVQLIYLLTLLGFLVVGAYLVVRQVLIRRDLEESAKVLGERVRSGSEDSEDLFQLGVILLRKKLYTQACKNLEKAKRSWGGDPEELAQVHNALGFAYFNMGKTDIAIQEYKQAVEKQPGYVTALNNLGDAYEKAKQQAEALSTYEEVLNYAPGNKVASSRVDALRQRV